MRRRWITRAQPHGVAVVSSESIVPRFVNFDQMPKHWKFSFPADFQFNACVSSLTFPFCLCCVCVCGAKLTCVDLSRAENGAVEQPTSAMRPFELVRPHDIVEVLLVVHALVTQCLRACLTYNGWAVPGR
jgi:hypothetical protein